MSATLTKKAAPKLESVSFDKRKTAARQSYLAAAERAEVLSRDLVLALTEHGRVALHGMLPAEFPSRQLEAIVERALSATDGGARGWTDVFAVGFADADENTRMLFLECVQSGSFPPSPHACRPLVNHLRGFYRERRRREIADNIRQALDQGDPIDYLLDNLQQLEADGCGGICDLLESRAFNFEMIPPKPAARLSLCGKALCTPGNISNVQAVAKAGKSAVIDAMIAAVLNGNRVGPDTLGFAAENPEGHALIHFDTEQSRYDADALVRRAMRRANVAEPPTWFRSFSIADLSIADRRDALRHALDSASKACGGTYAVLIDGIGDLCADPNDPEEAFALVHELHGLAIKHNAVIWTVLHENPGSETGKTRGHLGSQLERKAETNLRLAKDADGITTIWAERARHCHLPKTEGPCFSWNDQSGMHTSCGNAGEMKQAATREKMKGEAETVFSGDDSFKHSELMAAIGEALDLKERAAKLRIQKWTAEGIIRKDAAGTYHLTNP